MAKVKNSKNAAKLLLDDISSIKQPQYKTKSIPVQVGKPESTLENAAPEMNQNQSTNHNATTKIKVKLKQKSVYLTDKQIKAIKLKTIESEDPRHKDISSVIRAAIDEYLQLKIND